MREIVEVISFLFWAICKDSELLIIVFFAYS